MKRNPTLIVFVILLLSVSGCREEILPPDAFIGTKNSPVVENYRSYYNLQIDAENLNLAWDDSLKFRTNNAYLEVVNFDYRSGSIDMRLSNGDALLFSSNIDENRSGIKTSLEGQAPSKVSLRFNNFSGKFRIKLLPYN